MIRTIHLNPKAEFYPRVLLPGDPARALAIAQDVLDEPRMFNHRRGLWGYSGIAADGEGLLIQSSGMGGPSAAIVCEELIELGAETIVRVGTCGAFGDGLKLGDLIVVSEAISFDGTSRAVSGGRERLAADPEMVQRLELAAQRTEESRGMRVDTIATSDVFYDRNEDSLNKFARAGAVAVEMEAATVLAVTEHHGIRGACLLGVTDLLTEKSRERMEPADVEALGKTLGHVSARAVNQVV